MVIFYLITHWLGSGDLVHLHHGHLMLHPLPVHQLDGVLHGAPLSALATGGVQEVLDGSSHKLQQLSIGFTDHVHITATLWVNQVKRRNIFKKPCGSIE